MTDEQEVQTEEITTEVEEPTTEVETPETPEPEAPEGEGQEGEQEPVDAGLGEDEEDSETDDTQEGAPEEYAAFEVPEGMELDEVALGEFVPMARELNLSQEKAQQLVSVYASQIQRQEAEARAAAEAQEREWVKANRQDPEYQSNLAAARRAVDAYGGKELRQVLTEYGLRNHPVLVRAFAKAGLSMGETTLTRPTSTTKPGKSYEEKSREELLFPQFTNK